jgi:hypothetical protein
MLHAATSVDVAFVDPVGRPVTGICARVFLNLSGQTDSQPVGADGHLRVGRPESLSLFVVVDGVCGAHVEHWSASRHTFDLHRGANQVTFVVPWSAGDVVTEPVLMHGTEATYDLLAVSTQPNELDPSCIGSFGASRWFSMSSYPNGVDWGPVNGGVIKTTLSQGGTVAIWGYDGSRVVEIGCARAGQAVVVPPDLYPQIAVQVIPDPGPAQTGRTWYEA